MKVLNCQLRLDRLRQEERAVIVVMLQMMNEISILRKHLIFAGNGSENPKGAQRTAQRVVSLFLLRELAGKLYEGWEVLRKGYYGRRLSYSYEGRGGHLSAKGKQARGKIDAYFKATDCLIKRIRDKHTSHYDIEAVEEGMKSHGPANPCPMLLAE